MPRDRIQTLYSHRAAPVFQTFYLAKFLYIFNKALKFGNGGGIQFQVLQGSILSIQNNNNNKTNKRANTEHLLQFYLIFVVIFV